MSLENVIGTRNIWQAISQLGQEPTPYERVIKMLFFPDRPEVLLLTFSHDPNSNDNNKWRVMHLDIGLTKLIEPVLVLETGANDVSDMEWYHPGDGKLYISFLLNERNATSGFFNGSVRTHGPF